MICLHPQCPMGNGLASWVDVVNDPRINIRPSYRTALVTALHTLSPMSAGGNPHLPVPWAVASRLMGYCPCLYTQLPVKVTPSAIVHLCETTLGKAINSHNAYDAFLIQHPKTKSFRFPPQVEGAAGGDIMERLCSEILINHGLPQLEIDIQGWPVWDRKGHVSLNDGKMRAAKAFGDIMIPCAPSNLTISVKSEAAKERLLYSANMIEGVGFGFFNNPAEFWTRSRMKLFKRMGFTVIYMPDFTHDTVKKHLLDHGTEGFAINVNGTALYRPLSEFGDDMVRIAGKLSLNL